MILKPFVLTITILGLVGITGVSRGSHLVTLQPIDTHYCASYDAMQEEEVQQDLKQTFEELVEETTELFGGTGFTNSLTPQNLNLIGYSTYGADEGQSVSLDYYTHHGGSQGESIPARFFVLLDEQQIPGIVNSTDEYFHDEVLEKGEITHLSIELPPLERGIHNITVMGVPYAEDHPQMTNAHDISMLTQRITIIAGEDAVEVEHHQYTYLPAFAYIRDNAPALRVMFTLDETLDSWNYPELTLPVEPDSPLNFTIKAGYQPGNPGGSEVAQFAILLLQDYRQIPISPETDVFYGEVDSETAYAEIPVTLTTPLKTGKHDLIAIRIYSPAYALCDVLAVPERQIIEVWAERVAIEVVEAPQ